MTSAAIQQVLLAGKESTITYRYLRFSITKIIYASATQCPLYSIVFSTDGGSNSYPTSNMTSNAAPSPLVASSVDSDANAWKNFDGNNTTFVQCGPTFNGGVPPTPMYFTLDLGSGNGILPNAVKIACYNSGIDCSLVDFNIKGSNTGLFSGEEVTIKSWAGQGSKTHQALVTFT